MKRSLKWWVSLFCFALPYPLTVFFILYVVPQHILGPFETDHFSLLHQCGLIILIWLTIFFLWAIGTAHRHHH